MLNDRLDYFGQTVNIAARIQGLAVSHAIFASKSVIEGGEASYLGHPNCFLAGGRPRRHRACCHVSPATRYR
jgi:class 3 adenylate cyclase